VSAETDVLTLTGKSVLVTGGAGFIGSHLVDRLIAERPGRLIVVDNLFLGKRENLEEARRAYPSLRFYPEDVSRPQTMRRILEEEEVEIVFDLATIPLPASLRRPKWASRSILEMALNVCELGRQGMYRTLIHCSSSEAYGSAQYVPMDEAHPLAVETPYAAAKAAADLLVRSYARTFGLDTVIVRPFNTYGPRQNERQYAGVIPIVIRRILAGQAPVIYGDGEQTRDYTFVTDIAEGMVAASRSEAARGRVINLASGQEVSVNRLVRLICQALGYEGEIHHAPPRPADVRRHLADASLAHSLLGWRPRVSLEEGIARTVHWYVSRLGSAG